MIEKEWWSKNKNKHATAGRMIHEFYKGWVEKNHLKVFNTANVNNREGS